MSCPDLLSAEVYEDPYIGLAPRGPEGLFTEDELVQFFETLDRHGPPDGVGP